jgi:hypothetical protein
LRSDASSSAWIASAPASASRPRRELIIARWAAITATVCAPPRSVAALVTTRISSSTRSSRSISRNA